MASDDSKADDSDDSVAELLPEDPPEDAAGLPMEIAAPEPP